MGENTEEKRNGKTKYKMKKNRRIKIERPEIEKNKIERQKVEEIENKEGAGKVDRRFKDQRLGR